MNVDAICVLVPQPLVLSVLCCASVEAELSTDCLPGTLCVHINVGCHVKC